jgi:hypothetical protein
MQVMPMLLTATHTMLLNAGYSASSQPAYAAASTMTVLH